MTGRGLHHVELWVPDLARAVDSWGWLLGGLGYHTDQEWPVGQSWRCGEHYIVVEQSPALSAQDHDRHRPGLNHLAFHAGHANDVETMANDGPQHRGDPPVPRPPPPRRRREHYAACLQNADGFEVELVAEARRGSLSGEVARPTARGGLADDSLLVAGHDGAMRLSVTMTPHWINVTVHLPLAHPFVRLDGAEHLARWKHLLVLPVEAGEHLVETLSPLRGLRHGAGYRKVEDRGSAGCRS